MASNKIVPVQRHGMAMLRTAELSKGSALLGGALLRLNRAVRAAAKAKHRIAIHGKG